MPNKRTILIVDDDAELRDALVEQLALHEEFDATAVDSGTKAVQAAKGGQIDLVIMDVGLPDVDGREAVRILRKASRPSTSGKPTSMITRSTWPPLAVCTALVPESTAMASNSSCREFRPR